MLYPTHVLGGAVASVTLAEVAGGPVLPALIGGGVGALLPDLDTPSSKASQIVRFLVVVATVVWAVHAGPDARAALAAPIVVVLGWLSLRLLQAQLGHRGPTHSALVGAALAAVAFGLAAVRSVAGSTLWIIAYFAVGYLVGGLLLDACTVRGLPLLWPLSSEPLHLAPRGLRIRTGGLGELGVRGLLLATLVLWVYGAWGTQAQALWGHRQRIVQSLGPLPRSSPLASDPSRPARPRPAGGRRSFLFPALRSGSPAPGAPASHKAAPTIRGAREARPGRTAATAAPEGDDP